MKNKIPKQPNLAQNLVAGAAWAFVAKIIGTGSALFVNATLSRMLSPEDMGAYFVTISIVMLAAIIASFGLRQTVLRLVAESIAQNLSGRAGKALLVAFFISLTGSALVAGTYYCNIGELLASGIFHMPMLTDALGIISLWIVILTFQAPIVEVFRGLHNIRLAVFLDGVMASVLLAIIVLTFYLMGINLDYKSAILISSIAAAISLFFGIYRLWGRRTLFRGEGNILTREVISISAPFFVTNMANYAINNFSLWVVAANLPADEVALYGAAWRLVNLIALPIILINMAVNPIIVKLNTTNKKETLQRALRGTATLAAIPSFLVLFSFILFGSDILELIFGGAYGRGSGVLLILSAGMLVNVWTGSCGQVLAFTGHHRILMIITIITGSVSVMLAILAVKYMGISGVALAVAIGRMLQNVTYWLQVRRLTGLWTHGTLRPSFLKLAINRVRPNVISIPLT